MPPLLQSCKNIVQGANSWRAKEIEGTQYTLSFVDISAFGLPLISYNSSVRTLGPMENLEIEMTKTVNGN